MAPPLPACIALWWHFRLLCSPTFRTCCLHYGQSRCLVHGQADLTRNVSDSWKRWFLQKTLNNISVIFYFYSYYTTEAMICFCFFSFFFDWLLSKNQAGSSLSVPLQTFFSPPTLSSCPWKLLNSSRSIRCIIYPFVLGSWSTPVVPPSLHCPAWKWEIRSCSRKRN